VDVRVIATSNRDIRKRIHDQEFREDLYYRLNVVPLNLIPLRERIDDIPVLVGNFAKQFCEENGKSPIKIDSATLSLLKKYRWPGNIRELGNIVERSCLMCQGDTMLPSHLFFDEELQSKDKSTLRLSGTIYEMEKELIMQTLEEVNGNKTKAADSLGISIRTLRNKLNEYGETRPPA
jgi:DNA-binding NtrC family response regulator